MADRSQNGARGDFPGVFIHESAYVDLPSKIGAGTKIWHFVHVLADCVIGKECSIGQNVMIGPAVKIGDKCKIQNNVSLYNGVELEDGVFCGPSCVFTNVTNPRAEVERKSEFRRTLVKRGASIGANATIVCGHTLGEYCFIAAGAVVTGDVPPFALMAGVPARRIGWMSKAGMKLGSELICPADGSQYRELPDGRLEPVEAKPACAVANDDKSAPIAFIDLKAQQDRIRPQIDRAIKRVLDHGQYIMGPEVGELEKSLAAFAGAKHAISCASGTDALLIAMMAKGVGPGDAILCPGFTYTATPETIALLGATPVFVDVREDTFNVDPAALAAGLAVARTHGLRAVGLIAVDLFGLPADYAAVEDFARSNGLWVLADAAQSFGAARDGRRVGTFGAITATSFFPAKPLGCYGDGGAIFTEDDELAERMRSIRLHGKGADKYDIVRIGVNGRLDTLQAAILIEKLGIFVDEIDRRQIIAGRYSVALSDRLGVPVVPQGYLSVWAQYTVKVPSGKRDALLKALQVEGVPTNIHYPRPLHRQTAYRHYPVANNGLPVSERLAGSVLSLPMHPYLGEREQDYIIERVRRLMQTVT